MPLPAFPNLRRSRIEAGCHCLLLVWCGGLIDSQQLNDSVLPKLQCMAGEEELEFDEWENHPLLSLRRIAPDSETETVMEEVFSGQLLIFGLLENRLYSLNIASPPNRKTEESSSEVSVKGPRDGFVEDLQVNIALVRKRIRSNSLCCEQFVIGSRSKTEVALLYVSGIIREDILTDIRSRLEQIEVDSLLSSNQLEELIADSPRSLFPLSDNIGRPDFVVQSVLKGRFALLINGSPTAIIAPGNLMMLLKSPEDIHLPYYYVTFERIIRIFGFICALFLPGFWVSVSAYNSDQLPFPLLATITNSRIGLPLSAPMEAFVMMILFEVFREAGVRLPKAVGQTVAVVGGLIIGDAAIRAGLTSPSMLVVTSFTAVCSFTLVNQSLTGAVTILRLAVILICSAFGLFGLFLGMFGILLYLSTLRSFGVPYLAPISPPVFKDMLSALVRKPWVSADRKAEMLSAKSRSPQKGERK